MLMFFSLKVVEYNIQDRMYLCYYKPILYLIKVGIFEMPLNGLKGRMWLSRELRHKFTKV